jgi:4,5-DOPA dioxygenase extradiol
MDATLKHQDHYLIGQVLQQLRQEGVLIISSGNVVHNLGLLSRSAENSTPKWASGFNNFFKLHLCSDDFHPLIAFDNSSSYASLACPTPEHYLPALYTLGLKNPSESAQIICDGIEMSSISMLSFGFGLPPTQ